MPRVRPRDTASTASRAVCVLVATALLQEPAPAQDRDGAQPGATAVVISGDPARGRGIAMDRELGNCTLCHTLPNMDAAVTAGNLGPPLAGVGARLSAAELRLRLTDSTRGNPESVMPAYYRTDHLTQVAAAYRGKPILTAQQLEDVIAYLQGLR